MPYLLLSEKIKPSPYVMIFFKYVSRCVLSVRQILCKEFKFAKRVLRETWIYHRFINKTRVKILGRQLMDNKWESRLEKLTRPNIASFFDSVRSFFCSGQSWITPRDENGRKKNGCKTVTSLVHDFTVKS